MTTNMIAIIFLYCNLLGTQDTSRLTLTELARRNAPHPVFQSRTRELMVTSFEQVLPEAEVVIHGKVQKIQSYLSADERDIYTDYYVESLRKIRPAAAPAAKPGPVKPESPFIVTRWGGQLMINGVQVTQDDADAPPFRVGEQVILLLRRARDGKYEPVSVASGVFSVEDSKIKPFVRALVGHQAFDRLSAMTVAEFEVEVRRLSQ